MTETEEASVVTVYPIPTAVERQSPKSEGMPSDDLGLCFPGGRDTRFGSKSDFESNIPHWDRHVFYVCLPTNTPVTGKRNPAHKREKIEAWRVREWIV